MKLTLLLALAGCSSSRLYSSAATDQFEAQYACPSERQSIVAQPPPPEIAADPQRVELWRDGHHVYTIAGCGHTTTLTCTYKNDDDSSWIDCT